MSATEGVVFNIQKLTVHDGPGIRTTVFLKGCPLSCIWCSNPEGLERQPQVGVYSERCIGVERCGFCLQQCPAIESRALRVEQGRVVGIDASVCTGCLRCAEVCPSGALKGWGKTMTVADLMRVIMADEIFYRNSGGGVTLSGGEVFMQWPFALELLKACREAGIHRCVESTLHCAPDLLEQLLAETDLVIADIKHMDDVLHREKTGISNQTILGNIERTVQLGMPVILRVPIVTNYNDTEANMRSMADFILQRLDNRVIQVQLLPCRELGIDKYQALGLNYPSEALTFLEREQWEKNILELVEILVSYGIPAVAGTSVKY